jgi:ABC-type antimicrobial peptide transport system permease subunit
MIGNMLPASVAFTLRSNRTGTEGFLSDIGRALAAVDPNLPVASVNTVAAMCEISMTRTSFSLVLLAIAGTMALFLGVIGIYGVLAYAVIERQREVGIRLALGAPPHLVKRIFVNRGMFLSGAGIALGAGTAAGLTRLLSDSCLGSGQLMLPPSWQRQLFWPSQPLRQATSPPAAPRRSILWRR